MLLDHINVVLVEDRGRSRATIGSFVWWTNSCHSTMFTTAIRSFARTPSVSSFRRFSSRLSRQVALSSPVLAASLPRLAAVRPAGALARSFSCSAIAHFGPSVQANPPSHVLFVGNLPWSSTKEELQALFAEFGDVTSVRIR